MLQPFINDISEIIPEKHIQRDYLNRMAWGTDASFYRLVPKVVIHSESELDISSIVRSALKHNIPLTFRAAGTSLSGQSVTDSVLVVAGKGWEKYSISDDLKSIRLQTGITGKRVNSILKRCGKRFPPDPASINSAMVGGIVLNNASGMSCGIHENSYRMIKSVRIILSDGTLLDTGDKDSREAFKVSHSDFIEKLMLIRSMVMSDGKLVARIKKKYSIKNVMGLNILPFVEYEDLFDIITHLIVGSEGTLAFLSEVEMKTVDDLEFSSSGMLYFKDMRTASELVMALKGTPVSAVEFMDRKALQSIEYKSEAPIELRTLSDSATALLIKIEADSEHKLAEYTSRVKDIVSNFETILPVQFTTDAGIYNNYWALRSGIFPSVGGMRPLGTSCLIEDVAFPMDVFADAVEDLRNILDKNGYEDAVIYGHALEGNYHFILNQSFDTEESIEQYKSLMNDVVSIVVDKYDGSLKAEHGTGRNMAPFVVREWGDDAYNVMKEVKSLFDPTNIFNPGVIFNSDPECYVKNIKSLPITDPIIDKCIECGFCETNCLSLGFTLSPRQRIVIQREITRLRNCGEHPELVQILERDFEYAGNQTCAVDGLCSLPCPVGINVGDYIHSYREKTNKERPVNHKIGSFAANNFGAVSASLKSVLAVANVARTVVGNNSVDKIGRSLHNMSGKNIPLWTSTLPRRAGKVTLKNQISSVDKVVYFPSCLNQMMGSSPNDIDEEHLAIKMVGFLNKCGYEVIFPKQMKKMCCGTIWESKGMPDIADSKSKELEQALLEASDNGKYPVLCDQSPCVMRMKNTIKGVKIYDTIEFVDEFLVDRLDFAKCDDPVTIFATCSTKRMKLEQKLIDLANLCSTNVLVPEELNCCGFAGDKGFFIPELNTYALRKLPAQLNAKDISVGYSNSRTCEIGLSTNTGIPYMSIIYLIDKCSSLKKEYQ